MPWVLLKPYASRANKVALAPRTCSEDTSRWATSHGFHEVSDDSASRPVAWTSSRAGTELTERGFNFLTVNADLGVEKISSRHQYCRGSEYESPSTG